MKKYYYKTLIVKPFSAFNPNFPLDSMEDELNRLGQLGWELVSSNLQTNPTQLIIILKNEEGNLNSGK